MNQRWRKDQLAVPLDERDFALVSGSIMDARQIGLLKFEVPLEIGLDHIMLKFAKGDGLYVV